MPKDRESPLRMLTQTHSDADSVTGVTDEFENMSVWLCSAFLFLHSPIGIENLFAHHAPAFFVTAAWVCELLPLDISNLLW